ncbi:MULTISPECIES: response regulator transcription factor [unclassified Microbacterium]|uniref:response regulator transcription factor n=1 Tax=unclassified Microbacterium TaxID=2609290 RepID=UPI00214BB106|nr:MULTISPECIES: response regulator transcription factor [unclassified Microbacterium]MCR2784783.1 response regulator transcription factor [Microbacterium sp. zg.B96]WIM16322.1 response regulator transcription factor [Microbacterium sp. zg-B96]
MNIGAKGARAVVIEDDEVVRELLVDIFESAGVQAFGASNSADGVEAVLEHEPLITTVDINMPGIDGLETTRRVRNRSATHIIVVSALTEEADAVLALSAGADDFVAKPFRAREFRARVEAVLRRVKADASADASTPADGPAAGEAPAVLAYDDLVVDRATRIAARGGDDAGLTRTEFDLLVALMETGQRVRTKEELALAVRSQRGSSDAEVSDVEMRTIETHIAKLRRKLDEDPTAPRYVETVRGVGYRLTGSATRQ